MHLRRRGGLFLGGRDRDRVALRARDEREERTPVEPVIPGRALFRMLWMEETGGVGLAVPELEPLYMPRPGILLE